jgi:hypothetical protein
MNTPPAKTGRSGKYVEKVIGMRFGPDTGYWECNVLKREFQWNGWLLFGLAVVWFGCCLVVLPAGRSVWPEGPSHSR